MTSALREPYALRVWRWWWEKKLTVGLVLRGWRWRAARDQARAFLGLLSGARLV